MYLLFYKGTSENPKATIWDRFICAVTRSRFSHVEISFNTTVNEYVCWSSSTRDKGVRSILVPKTSERWVVLPLTANAEEYVFFREAGKRYDYIGLLGTVIHTHVFSSRRKWFCSEIVAESLGLKNSWKYSPEDLYKLYK